MGEASPRGDVRGSSRPSFEHSLLTVTHALGALSVLVVAWGALAFGAVYPWAYRPLLAGCAAIGAIGAVIVGRDQPWPRSERAFYLALAAVALAGVVQLLPLPVDLLARVSPGADAFLREHDLAYAAATSPGGRAAALPPELRLGLASTHALSINPGKTALALTMLGAFSLFLLGTTRVVSRTGAAGVSRALVVVGFVLALIGIIQKALLGDDPYQGMRLYGFWQPRELLTQPFGPFVNRNHFAGWMAMVVPVGLGLAAGLATGGIARARGGFRERLLWLASRGGSQTLLALMATLVMGLSLVITNSRSGMGSLALALMVGGAWSARRTGRRVARLAALSVPLVLIAVVGAWAGVTPVLDRFSSSSAAVELRLGAWRDSIRILRDFPITGTGLNTFGTATLVYPTASELHLQEAHNDYLQLAVEGGALAGVPIALAIALFVRAIARRFRERRDDPSTEWLRMGASIGLIAIAIQSSVEFSLQMPGNAALFCVVAAIALHRAPRVRTAPRGQQ